jgi:hypothetical protein
MLISNSACDPAPDSVAQTTSALSRICRRSCITDTVLSLVFLLSLNRIFLCMSSRHVKILIHS